MKNTSIMMKAMINVQRSPQSCYSEERTEKIEGECQICKHVSPDEIASQPCATTVCEGLVRT